MDLDTLSKGVGLFGVALSALKQAIELLPDSSKKEDAEAAYLRAEREFKIAEAEMADRLQFEICRNHFPPEIMLSKDDIHWRCSKCGGERDISAKPASGKRPAKTESGRVFRD